MAKSLGAHVENFSRSKTETNVKDSSDVKRALEEFSSKHGTIDFVINTAGLLKISRIDSLTDADVENLIGVNYLGAVNVARASYKYLKESKWGPAAIYQQLLQEEGQNIVSIHPLKRQS